MADTKLTGLTELTSLADVDLMYIVDDPSGSPASKKVALSTIRDYFIPPSVVEGRLTLTTATPVTTADVTGATTLYFTPYKGNRIGVYDGSKWEIFSFTEKSLDISGLTASTPYDIFIYDNSGTLTLEATAWSDATTRATALTTQDGIYVKTGATTRRYLGTIYINSTGGQTDDSVTKRFVWNYYNRVWRSMHLEEGTGHTYASTTGRYWNNDSNQKFQLVIGVQEGVINAGINALTTASASAPRVFLALDSNTFDNNYPFFQNQAASGSNYGFSFVPLPCFSVGYHYLAVSEALTSGSTTSTFTVYFADVSIKA